MRVYAGICSRFFGAPRPDAMGRRLTPSYQLRRVGPAVLIHDDDPPVVLTRDGISLIADISDSDAAKALDAYCSGESFLNALRNEFSVVIADPIRRRIVAGTDRLGLIPIYYALIGEDFVWSTVPSLVAQHRNYAFRPDEFGIAQFLFGFARSDGRSFYAGISRLLPATQIEVTPGREVQTRYWYPRAGAGGRRAHLPPDQEGQAAGVPLRDALVRSISSRFKKGETGLLLSGGLDSSSIACLAAEAGMRLRTYSLVFDDKDADERHLIDLVVRKYGLPHRRIDVPSQIPDSISIADAAGCPDLAYVPNVQMHAPQFAQMREDGVTVSLDGIGGDQLFAATSQGRWTAFAPRIARFLRRRRNPELLLGAMRLDAALWHRVWQLLERSPPGGSIFGSAPLLRAIESMALLGHQHFIHTKSPFLDEDVMTAVGEGQIRSDKQMLREAVNGIVPEAIRSRRVKAHFTAWFDYDLRVRQRDTVAEILAREGPAESLMTAAARRGALQYRESGAHPAGRWIVSNWLAVQQWWSSASKGAFYVREQRSAKERLAETVGEAGPEIVG